MFFWKIFYNGLVLPLLTLFSLVGYLVHPKIRQGVRGRFQTLGVLRTFFHGIDPDRTVYWFHAASHGEFEQVRPVLAGLKEVEPDCVAVVSFFSPSGYVHVTDPIIDCKVYLPHDFPWTVRRALRIVHPRKLILAAYDIWPNLIWTARQEGVHTTLFATRFSRGTSKLYPVIRSFYHSVYEHLAAIYTISEDDYVRLQRILDPAGRPLVRVLGNPRYDQVKTQAEQFTVERTESVRLRQRRIIAGSVHAEDEANVAEPIIRILQEYPEVSLFWVPHEPNQRYVDHSVKLFQERGFPVRRLGNAEDFNAHRVVVVDVVGILAQLYWEGQIAYVGGGFSSGVHNVMEPAIARLPVFFGPRYNDSQEAEELIAAQGGFSIQNGQELYDGIVRLLNNRVEFISSSYSATSVIHRNLGSSTRVVRSIIRD